MTTDGSEMRLNVIDVHPHHDSHDSAAASATKQVRREHAKAGTIWYHASWRDDSGTVRTESVCHCTIVDWKRATRVSARGSAVAAATLGRLSLSGRNSPIDVPGLKSQKEM